MSRVHLARWQHAVPRRDCDEDAAPESSIRTAVFPVAGRGTRFLPATKASPKEMLPVVDKPLIQYAVEEALAAGARRLVFITGASKRAIEDHFDSDQELEHMLEAQGKSDLLNQLRSVLPSYASCIYIRQPAPLGLGHAVLCAQPAVGAEPFFVHLADDLIRREVACLRADGARSTRRKRASVLGVQIVPRQDTDKYGIVAVEAEQLGDQPRAQHRREAEARGGAVEPGGRGPLRADAGDLRAPGEDRRKARAARSSSPTASPR